MSIDHPLPPPQPSTDALVVVNDEPIENDILRDDNNVVSLESIDPHDEQPIENDILHDDNTVVPLGNTDPHDEQLVENDSLYDDNMLSLENIDPHDEQPNVHSIAPQDDNNGDDDQYQPQQNRDENNNIWPRPDWMQGLLNMFRNYLENHTPTSFGDDGDSDSSE